MSKRIIAGYGFWVLPTQRHHHVLRLLCDLRGAGGRDGRRAERADLFDLRSVGLETACLLLSSFTCGVASIGASAGRTSWFYVAMAVTFLFGAGFLALELHESSA